MNVINYVADFETYGKSYYDIHKKTKSYAHLLLSVSDKQKEIIHFDVNLEKWFTKLFDILEFSKKRYIKFLGEKVYIKETNIWFHNGSNFDLHFLWDIITKKEYEIDYFMDGKKTLYTLRIKKGDKIINFRDNARNFPQKLSALGELLKIPKTSIDNYDITEEFKTNEDYYKFNNGDDYNYLYNDCLILKKWINYFNNNELINSIRLGDKEIAKTTKRKYENYKKAININNLKITSASSSYNFFVRSNKKDYDLINNLNGYLDPQTWIDFKKSFFGGFTYLIPTFSLKILEGIKTYDINSLYPYIMKSNVFPVGDIYEGYDKFSTFHLYKVKIKKMSCKKLGKNKDKILPFVSNNGENINIENLQPIYYNSDESIKVNNYLPEYKDIEFYWNNYWKDFVEEFYDIEYEYEQCLYSISEKANIFNDFINTFENLKIKSELKGDKVVRTIAKLWMNGVYGKFAQRIQDIQSKIITTTELEEQIKNNSFDFRKTKEKGIIWKYYTDEEGIIHRTKVEQLGKNIHLYKINNGYVKQRGFKYMPIATKITTMARIHLLRTAIDNIDSLVYMDTDSIHLNLKKDEEGINIDIDNTRFGAWKFEGWSEKSVYRRPKHYLHINTWEKDNNEWKLTKEYELKGGGFGVNDFNKDGERYKEITIEDYAKEELTIERGNIVKKFVEGGPILYNDKYIFKKPVF